MSETPRTDTTMAAIETLAPDTERMVAACRIALSMMEYDLNKARAEADTLRDRLGKMNGIMAALEMIAKRMS